MPENPGGQLQLNPLFRSMHVPLFKQGLLSHSFISEGNMIKDYLQINICALLTKRVISQVLSAFLWDLDQYKCKTYGSQEPRPMVTYAACWSSNIINMSDGVGQGGGGGGGGGSYFPYILLNEIQTMFSQLAKRSARVLPADLVLIMRITSKS